MKERIEKLEKELAKLKAEASEEGFEEGQWIISDNGVLLKYKEEITGNSGVCGFGVTCDWKDDWHKNSDRILNIEDYRPATEDEIKEALVAEAKRRGLVKGAKFKTPSGNWTYIAGSDEYRYYLEKPPHLASGDILSLDRKQIYNQGDWAEVIEDTVTINGVELEVSGDKIELPCGDNIPFASFIPFHELVHKYDLRVHRQGEDITPQIKKLGQQI